MDQKFEHAPIDIEVDPACDHAFEIVFFEWLADRHGTERRVLRGKLTLSVPTFKALFMAMHNGVVLRHAKADFITEHRPRPTERRIGN